MSSAICFNLDPSKILSSGNGLMQLRNALYEARHHLIMDPYKSIMSNNYINHVIEWSSDMQKIDSNKLLLR